MFSFKTNSPCRLKDPKGCTFKKFPKVQSGVVYQKTVFDVAMDFEEWVSYLQWYGLEMSEKRKKKVLIPREFAHRFLVLSNIA